MHIEPSGKILVKGSMKLNIVKDTVLKSRAVASSELASEEKTSVKSGVYYVVKSWLKIDGHIKAEIDGKTMFVYGEHCEVIGDDGVKLFGVFKVGEKLPKKVNLKVPFLSQLDNKYRPQGTCNITSVAMCLEYYGLSKQRARQCEQLEDDLYLTVENNGWDRHVHEHLVKLLNLYGVTDNFSCDTPWSDIKRFLANGNPVIYSGQFTRSGHIIVIRGYDDDKKSWIVNDPNGEWFSNGYVHGDGKEKYYSYSLLKNVSYSGDDAGWAHLLSR
jgi:hypothetical protein